LVVTENGMEIKVSKEHKFFTNAGWVEVKDLIANEHKILCDTGEYSTVLICNLIGMGPIVDITVDHPEHCYFGNGMLNHNSGKSLLSANALRDTQKKGGTAVFIDTETAVSKEYLQAIGVDIKSMLYVHLETIEDIFDTVEHIIEKVRNTDKKRIVTIVIDSIAGATTKAELDQAHGPAGYATQKAIAISKAMRKITNMIGKQRILLICTNQLRQKVGEFMTAGSDPFTTSGGKALGFHASVRIRLKQTGKIKNKDGDIVGVKTKATVIKNRMGPPFRSAEFNIFFDRGVDNYGTWADTLFEAGFVSSGKIDKLHPDGKKKTKTELEDEKAKMKAAKSYQFDLMNIDGTIKETVVFEKSKLPTLLKEREDVKEYLYDKIAEMRIFQYQNQQEESDDEFQIESASVGLDD
jgi:protein RecA